MSFFEKKSNIIITVIAGLIIFTMMSFFSIRNELIILEEDISGNWAQVENQLQRRYELLPNLINTVKGVAKHEKEIFTDLANARAKLAGAQTPAQTMQASSGMESALSRLLVVVENYPNLKASESFNRLMDELAGTENRLAVERRRFNESVKFFNRSIRLFPKSAVANFSGFEKKDYFKIEEAAKTAPKVQF